MLLLIKQCEHVYMHVIFIITFLFVCLFFGRFLVKKAFFLEFRICKFDENKNKNLLKKKKKIKEKNKARTNAFQNDFFPCCIKEWLKLQSCS